MESSSRQEYNSYYAEDASRWEDPDKNAFCSDIMAVLARDYFARPPSILDVGCGVGFTLKALSLQLPRSALFGLDPSDVAIKIAQTRIPGAQFFRTDLAGLETSHTYDIVALLGVIEHIQDTALVLATLGKLIAPSGLAYIEVPHNLSYDESNSGEGFRRLPIYSRQWEWHRKRRTWEEFFEQAGLDIVCRLKGCARHFEFIWILSRRTDRVFLSSKVLKQLAQIENIYLRKRFLFSQNPFVRFWQEILGPKKWEPLRKAHQHLLNRLS